MVKKIQGAMDEHVQNVSSGTAVTGPSPALAKKVKKILEINIDDPDLEVALGEISSFYGPNSFENRRSLRSSIEKRNVQISQSLVQSFSGVIAALDKVEADITVLAECSARMQQRVKAAHSTTSQVVNITEQLQRKETETQAHKALISAFLSQFRLSAQELQVRRTKRRRFYPDTDCALQTLQVDAISDEFLSILSKLGEIQTKCRQLLRFHHKTALMELVDETNALQENAYGRLHRWLQQQFSAISPEVSDLPLLLRRCLQALRSRPALFKVTCPADREREVGRRRACWRSQGEKGRLID